MFTLLMKSIARAVVSRFSNHAVKSWPGLVQTQLPINKSFRLVRGGGRLIIQLLAPDLHSNILASATCRLLLQNPRIGCMQIDRRPHAIF